MINIHGKNDGSVEITTEHASASIPGSTNLQRVPQIRGAIVHSDASYLLIKPTTGTRLPKGSTDSPWGRNSRRRIH